MPSRAGMQQICGISKTPFSHPSAGLGCYCTQFLLMGLLMGGSGPNSYSFRWRHGLWWERKERGQKRNSSLLFNTVGIHCKSMKIEPLLQFMTCYMMVKKAKGLMFSSLHHTVKLNSVGTVILPCNGSTQEAEAIKKKKEILFEFYPFLKLWKDCIHDHFPNKFLRNTLEH